MTRYRLEFKPSAGRAFLGLPRDVQRRPDRRLLALQDEPRPPGTKALAGETGLYRLRVGDYRIVYDVHDKEMLVLVLAIGHRREVYRRRYVGRQARGRPRGASHLHRAGRSTIPC